MDLLNLANNWLKQDPDESTRAELAELIAQNNERELANRFSKTLEFGTAGLRGELGAGPNRMNRIVVARAAMAIGKYLIDSGTTYADKTGHLSVVIGYDARVNSDIFARDSAEILAAMGLKVSLFDRQVPTPVTAFAGKFLSASASIMVTASHNPPRDNGYKVYLGGPNGHSQLTSPADSLIAGNIAEISERFEYQEIPRSSNFSLIGEEMISRYQDRAIELASKEVSDLRICYTALHGVGWAVTEQIFRSLGFTDVTVVPEQIEPNGQFPTVAFPNPEEKGAMDLSYRTATDSDCEVIIAHDPDADRLAVAIPVESGWRMLTGDEVGLLLAERLASEGYQGTFANSIVSSDQISNVAQHYRLGYKQTLTGFKWISKTPDLSFGYEEALGFCVDPEHTPDKDGITAAVKILGLARDLKKEGKNLRDQLENLAQEYGYVQTSQISIRVEDLSIIGKIMSGLRAQIPSQLGSQSVSFKDLAKGKDLPATDAVILESAEVRAIFRPSGTEPKLKCYLLARGESAAIATKNMLELRAAAEQLLNALK